MSLIKQFDKESIQEYANRVEKTYHDLTYALIVGKSPIETKIIAQTIQSQALSIFISGIHYSIRIILKASKPATFEEAVFIALEEEKSNERTEYRNNNNRNRSFNKNNNSNKNQNVKCHRCNRFGHYSNECRTSEYKLNNFRNSNNAVNRAVFN